MYKDQKYFIISDTHFWHPLMLELGIRSEWFEHKIFHQLFQLPEDAIIIHLGDVCIGNDKKRHTLLSNVPQKKILVRWNHDRKSNTRYYNNWWDFVCDSFTLKYANYDVLFTHRQTLTDWYINIHWHNHVKYDQKEEIKNWSWCYSLEHNNNIPIKLENILKNFIPNKKSWETINY